MEYSEQDFHVQKKQNNYLFLKAIIYNNVNISKIVFDNDKSLCRKYQFYTQIDFAINFILIE